MAFKRTTARLVFVTLALAALAAALTGCGGDSGSGEGADTGASPKAGGTITVAAQNQPAGLNPYENWDLEAWIVFWQIQDAPYGLEVQPDGLVKMVPVLAEDMPELSADGKSYTFKLKEGVMFQPPVDREVTAEDVKYSVEAMLATPRCPGTWYFSNIVGVDAFLAGDSDEVTGITVLDKDTVKVDLIAPNISGTFPFSTQFAIVVPKEWHEKWGDEIGRHPLGTGPYMLESWTEGREIVLTRNPNYWGTTYADEYVLKFGLSPTTQALQVKSGEADFMWSNIAPADMASLKADPEWKEQIVTSPGVEVDYLFLKTNMAPLDNVDVRQAIAWAIDRDKLCKLQAGQAEPAGQQVPKGMNVWEPDADYVGYDPAKAKELLGEAGYPDGFSTTLYCYSSEPLPTLFQSIQSDLAAIGIEAELRTMSKEAFIPEQTKPDKMPMGFHGWMMDLPDPFDWYEGYVTSAGIYPGGWNSALFDDPEINEALADAQAELDPNTRIEKFRNVGAMVMAEMPYVPLFQTSYAQLVSPSIGGFYQHPFFQFVFKDYYRTD